MDLFAIFEISLLLLDLYIYYSESFIGTGC